MIQITRSWQLHSSVAQWQNGKYLRNTSERASELCHHFVIKLSTNKIIKGMYGDQKFLNTLKKRAVKKLIKKMYLMVYKQIHGKTMSEV